MNSSFTFDHSYATRFPSMVRPVLPTPVASPSMAILNEPLAKELGIQATESEWVAWGSGNQLPAGAHAVAMAYSGHQYGHYTQLGDGRAIVLGEHVMPDKRRVDIQLKGAGITPYSRRGDGRATLGPMLREYIISEAMHALNIPTTRSLMVVQTGEGVWRDDWLPGAILTRVAASHIRIGTFEQLAKGGDLDLLQDLLGYTATRHGFNADSNDVIIQEMVNRQLDTVMNWMRVGFIHGVMNTDNMALSGETLDYGPCAWVDEMRPMVVYSYIDRWGRYSYQNQPSIALWNLGVWMDAVSGLLKGSEGVKAEKLNQFKIDARDACERKWTRMMANKVGWVDVESNDDVRLKQLIGLMSRHHMDFTNTFAALTIGEYGAFESIIDMEWGEWMGYWQYRQDNQDTELGRRLMRENNPVCIPRNHWVERGIKDALEGDMSLYHRLLSVYRNPYSVTIEGCYRVPPTPDEVVVHTYCGT